MARKLDNIDLDVIDADRLGYGPHYGHFKADHPYTKEANEARLIEKKKPAPPKKMYELKCHTCGELFAAKSPYKRYCCSKCKSLKSNTFYKAKEKQKQEKEL